MKASISITKTNRGKVIIELRDTLSRIHFVEFTMTLANFVNRI